MVFIRVDESPLLLVINIKPNCSLSWRANVLVFLVLLLFIGSYSAVAAYHGAWLVTNFAALETLMLGTALFYCRKRLEKEEKVLFSEDKVAVKCGTKDWVCQRAWMRVVLRSSALRNYPSRLYLTDRGRQCELGSYLCENERQALARSLRAAQMATKK